MSALGDSLAELKAIETLYQFKVAEAISYFDHHHEPILQAFRLMAGGDGCGNVIKRADDEKIKQVPAEGRARQLVAGIAVLRQADVLKGLQDEITPWASSESREVRVTHQLINEAIEGNEYVLTETIKQIDGSGLKWMRILYQIFWLHEGVLTRPKGKLKQAFMKRLNARAIELGQRVDAEKEWNDLADYHPENSKKDSFQEPVATPSIDQSLTTNPPCQIANDSTVSAGVSLQGRENAPIVNGKAKQKLTKAQYDVVEVLIDAGKHGLSKDDFDFKSTHSDARKILGRVAAIDPDWESVIVFPKTSGNRYRIIAHSPTG